VFETVSKARRRERQTTDGVEFQATRSTADGVSNTVNDKAGISKAAQRHQVAGWIVDVKMCRKTMTAFEWSAFSAREAAAAAAATTPFFMHEESIIWPAAHESQYWPISMHDVWKEMNKLTRRKIEGGEERKSQRE
jgi:hypothetical protein